MGLSVVRTHCSPLMILALLERADTALARGELTTGRQYVESALQRLQAAKQAQDDVLADWTATPEAPGTSLDLGT
jgi:hypothetical protein